MTDWTGKRYWLVGASEGLGRALALKLSAAGAELILSARNKDRLDELAGELPGKSSVVCVDISDTASCRSAADAAGQIDGIVFLAAVYWPMIAQNWEADAVEKMCDINLTGAARILGAALPSMIERDRGHVVLTGSLSGFRGLPGAIGYSASKAGLMALGESLYADLRKTGVNVQLANPGFIKTRLTDMNDFRMPFLMTAEEAADQLLAHMKSRRFKKSFPRHFSWVFRLSQFLPDWAYYRLFA